MIASGLTTSGEAIFDLDFHAVMAWGHDPALEKHYVPTRSQRSRSVLTFFAQDTGTRNLVYANADLTKASQNREVIAFCDHWKAAFRLRLPGNYAHATPDTLQRRFLDTPGEITTDGTSITVKINRRAYSPVLRGADLPADTAVPWWGGRQLHFEFA